MKCQILFSGEKKRNISLKSAEFDHSVLSVKNMQNIFVIL